MSVLRNVLTISKREVTRFRNRFSGRSRFIIPAIVVLCVIISLILYHQDFVLSKDLYTVGVSPDGPAITDQRFNVFVADPDTGFRMLDSRAIDVYINGSKVYVRSDQRSQYAAGALEQYFKNAELARIIDEYDIGRAFPLRIEISNMARSPDAEMPVSLSDVLGPVEDSSLSSDMPVSGGSASGDNSPPPGQPVTSSTDSAVRQQLDHLEHGEGLPKFKAEFVSDKEIVIPSLMDPPVPLAQVIMAFLYIVPIFFVSVFFTSSFIEEKIDRKLIILLSSPVTPLQVILGKILPYFGYSIVVIIVITLLLKGNILLALAIFLPVMLFILSIYLMVALTYRTFRDQTFFSVLAVAIITAYLVAPAMFTGVSDLSYISPLTLAVQMYQGESFGLTEYFLSTAPMYLIFMVAMFVGSRIFNEEYLIGFKPLYKKFAEAVYLSMDHTHPYISVFGLSLLLVPLVFMIQLASIVIASNLPTAFIFGAAMVVSIAVEEIAKSAGVVVLLYYNRIKSLKNVVFMSFISALGFFIAEKLLLFLALSVITESVFTTAIFSTGLLVLPFILHFFSTSIVCLITARFSTRYYPLAIMAGLIVHSLYNLYVIGVIL